METQPTSQRGTYSPPIFGPCLLWPNGWIHQDATWCGGRSRSRPHCVRWDRAPPKRGHSIPTFRPMSIVAKRLDGSRCHVVGGRPPPRPPCVRWGPSSPPLKGAQQLPYFRSMRIVTTIVTKRSLIAATVEHLSKFLNMLTAAVV